MKEEYIKKSDMIDWLKDIRHKMKPQNYHTASEFEIAENQIWNFIQMLQMGAFPTVAIPSAEPCEDAISRQAVIDAIYDMEILKYRIDLENVIKALPSVKPQKNIVNNGTMNITL